MNIAIHLRDPTQWASRWDLTRDLERWYQDVDARVEGADGHLVADVDRIFVGDEFCLARMPDLQFLTRFSELAACQEVALSLLCPVLTDEGLQRCDALFRHMASLETGVQVVANDWGTLIFLQQCYPHLPRAAGRLLAKGYKDPRLDEERQAVMKNSPSIAILSSDSFDQIETQNLLGELGVGGVLRDVLPYAEGMPLPLPELPATVTFPFGYFTTGRPCAVAAVHQSDPRQFVAPYRCPRPCTDHLWQLKHPAFHRQVFQSGNTLYYRHPPSILAGLLEAGQSGRFRLLYQGLALGGLNARWPMGDA